MQQVVEVLAYVKWASTLCNHSGTKVIYLIANIFIVIVLLTTSSLYGTSMHS